jgi:hypothetical protein
MFQGRLPGRQGRNMALAILHVPYSFGRACDTRDTRVTRVSWLS